MDGWMKIMYEKVRRFGIIKRASTKDEAEEGEVAKEKKRETDEAIGNNACDGWSLLCPWSIL